VGGAPTDRPQAPRLFRTLSQDVRQVAADLQHRGVRRSFDSALDDVESFYLDEASRGRLAAMGRVGRTVRRVIWLIRSLLMKLTPARRILLALALLLLVPGIHLGGQNGVHIDFQSPIASAVLVVIVLMLELKDKLIARNELVAGRAVQLALMPLESPAVPGWDVWLYTRPANDVGGDLVDYLQIDARQHGIALGDVAGKALPAALLSVKLQATIRALVPHFPSLDALGAAVNRILCRDGVPSRFATLVYLVLANASGHVRYLNAGHLPPLRIRGSTVDELRTGSMALGFFADAVFSEQTLHLSEGDALVVVSDGVVEAMDAGGAFFGDDRLRAVLLAAAGQSAQQVGEAILTAWRAFLGDATPHDDVSVVVVRRLPASPSTPTRAPAAASAS
jgi:hypothetical protein